MKNQFSLPLFIILLLSFSVFTAAQENSELNDQLVNCETGLVIQDIVINATLEKTKNGGVLIIIVRLGDGETSRELIRHRIFNVHEFFRTRGSQIPPDKVIVAEGERIKGLGRLEYHLDGKLYQQLLFRKNDYVCHSCCGPDERFYPDKEVYERQQRQRKKKRKSN